jgi:hypothetical protein
MTHGSHKTRKRIWMHRFIMNTPDGMETDHRDMIRLNNQRYNLRTCTKAQNQRNRTKLSNNTSGFKGVTFNNGRIQSQIKIDGKLIYLGTFPTPIKAAQAYNDAAIKYFGEFARLNEGI